MKILRSFILIVSLIVFVPCSYGFPYYTGGPIDAGGGNYFDYTVAIDGPLVTITYVYYGPSFPVPVVVIWTEDGNIVMYPIDMSVLPISTDRQDWIN